MVEYKYARGDLMGTPNTYFYAAFEGREFVKAWWDVRQAALDALPVPTASAPAFDPQASGTAALLEAACREAESEVGPNTRLPTHVEMFLRKFEIGKRVYDAYDRDLRPIDREKFRTPSHYVRVAEALEAAFAKGGDLRALNALLKCVDTLIAHLAGVEDDLRPRLARLIVRERGHICELAARKGVSFPSC